MIWQRLQETDANWRLCYKALLLCEHLIKQGPLVCLAECMAQQCVVWLFGPPNIKESLPSDRVCAAVCCRRLAALCGGAAATDLPV